MFCDCETVVLAAADDGMLALIGDTDFFGDGGVPARPADAGICFDDYWAGYREGEAGPKAWAATFGAFATFGDGGVPALAADPVVYLAACYVGYCLGILAAFGCSIFVVDATLGDGGVPALICVAGWAAFCAVDFVAFSGTAFVDCPRLGDGGVPALTGESFKFTFAACWT